MVFLCTLTIQFCSVRSLFINVAKIEVMRFGTAARLASADSFNIHIDGKKLRGFMSLPT